MSDAVAKVTRPVLRWHGGKWKLAPWIISHFPAHRVYVEPFGGAGSVLMRKARCHAEVWNDLDCDVVNLFRVLQAGASRTDLLNRLRMTPFARAEFALAYEASADDVERARRLIIRSFMGMGSVSNAVGSKATGFRANVTRSSSAPLSAIPAHDWLTYPDALSAIIDRFAGVIIESRDALKLIEQYDGADTLFYFDPPYLPETRSKQSRRAGDGFVAYAHEMSSEEHSSFLSRLRALDGMAVVSGYPDPLYDAALYDWRRVECAAMADGARPRVEVLWINPRCAAALDRPKQERFL